MASQLSSLSGVFASLASRLSTALGPLQSVTQSLWESLGKRFLSLAVPMEQKLGGMVTHTAFTFVVFWATYIPLYNFYRAIDKKNLMGLQKYKLHPDRMESQELNDRVTGGLAIGFWKGAVRTAMAYWVFFSHGRQPVNSFPASPFKLGARLVIAYFIFDFGFYWLHRAEHLPYFYQRWHKQHHEFKVTNVGATSWNDARESLGIMVLNNLTANLFKMDLFTWLAWTAFGTYLDFHVHCGYKFPWHPANLLIDPPVHDYHHYQNKGNFATSHWDMVFGTNQNWLKWQKQQEARKAKGLGEEAERRTDDFEEAEMKAN